MPFSPNNSIYVHPDVESTLSTVFTNYDVLDSTIPHTLKPSLVYTQLKFNSEEYYTEIFFNNTIIIIPNWYYQKHNYIPYGICVKNMDIVLDKPILRVLNTIGIIHFNKMYYVQKNVKVYPL